MTAKQTAKLMDEDHSKSFNKMFITSNSGVGSVRTHVASKPRPQPKTSTYLVSVGNASTGLLMRQLVVRLWKWAKRNHTELLVVAVFAEFGYIIWSKLG